MKLMTVMCVAVGTTFLAGCQNDPGAARRAAEHEAEQLAEAGRVDDLLVMLKSSDEMRGRAALKKGLGIMAQGAHAGRIPIQPLVTRHIPELFVIDFDCFSGRLRYQCEAANWSGEPIPISRRCNERALGNSARLCPYISQRLV